MDNHHIKHLTRTIEHVRRVQDWMLYIITECSEDLGLSIIDQYELMENMSRHDLSKFTPLQFNVYCNKFQRKDCMESDFELAFRDHWQHENHHMQSGKVFGHIELIEVCCDIQAMADEFGEGSCRGYWHNKWLPKYGQMHAGPAVNQAATYMEQVIACFERKLGSIDAT